MAKSFANCINTLVKSGEMSSTLADDLKARAEVYARGGYSAKDAHEMAITDALQEQQDDLRAVYAQIGMAPADDPLLVADTSAAAAPVATGDTSPVPVAETPESEQVSSSVADAATVSEEVPAQEAKTPEAPGRMNMRHTVKMADILTPAGAIKSDARNGNGRIWYHQGDPNAIQFAAKVTFGGKPAPARAIAEWESLKKAQELGYQLRNLKAGSLGTVWILHKDGKHVLTADGFEAITRPEFDRPVREVTGPGYDNMVSGQAQYATKLAEWFATLPESTLQSASALATKIGQTPIGEWASISRERNGELRFEFKTANGKRDLYHFGGETYADQVRMIVTLAGEAKNKGDLEWFQVTAAAERKAAEANAADTPILDLLASYGFTKSAPAQTEAPSRYTPQDGDYSLDEHTQLIDAMNAGTLSLADYQAAFQRAKDGQEALRAEFAAMTKDRIMKTAGIGAHHRNDAKDKLVRLAVDEVLGDFDPREMKTWTYGTDRHGYIAKVTQEDLTAYAERRKARIAEWAAERAAMVKGIDNPQTLDDYQNYIRAKKLDGMTFADARMTLTPEQRATYDELLATQTRNARQDRADQQKSAVQVAAKTTEGQIVQTKHTRTGQDLFVVKAAERVERDVYNQWNATAKKLGGWYSSFRGNGAVPGFQFKTMQDAEAFLQYLGGNTSEAKAVMQERRDAFADDKTQSAVERLREMADAADETADEVLGRDRKTNTARRARFAAAAESEANKTKAMAQTMRNIAQAIENGSAKFLDRVRTKIQIEMLNGIVGAAQWEYWRKKYPTYAEQERHTGERPTPEVADYVTFPYYTAYRSDLARLGRELLESDGTKKLGQKLLSVADDVTDAYLAFAKANLHKVSTFRRSDGNGATFPNREQAEAAIKRSGFKGKAIVLQVKRGQNIIIQSPSLARENGIWQGDDDKSISLENSFGAELVAKAKEYKRPPFEIPHYFYGVAERQARLAAMGIETPAELRAMLREFIAMKQAPKAPDRVKALEREMAGKRNTDGLDFFPTPASAVQAMLDAAEIESGMRVLEPSAGMGHIAEKIRDAGVEPDVVELSNDRKELLEAKGFNVVGRDFMDIKARVGFTYGDLFRAPDGTTGIMQGSGGIGSSRVVLADANGRSLGYYDRDTLEGVEQRKSGYDRIIMNPPFGDRRDAEHVRHAYTLLAPGGRIVAIMGEGSFFGQDKKAQDFRDWLESVGGTSEKLEQGTFLDPSLPVNTGVNARMVVIDKPKSGLESRSAGTAAAYERRIAELFAGEPAARADKATSRQFLASSGLQLPRVMQSVAGSSRKIYTDADLVKYRAQRPQESVARATSPVIAAERARYQAVVDKFVKRFKGAAALDIRLVSNRNEIPERYRPSPFAEGVFHSGIATVWLVTDNLTPARANQVLLHEAIGHYGLASMMGQRFSGLLPSVKRVARAKATLVEDTLRPGDADYATWEAVKLRYPEASDVDVAQEVLARMAETDPEASFLAYARAVIRKWLREAARALGFDMDVSATELNDLVILASAHVRRGDNLADDAIEPEIAAASRSPEDLGRNIGAGVTAQTIADIPNPLIDRALAAAREAQNQSNAFDIEEEINSVRESGEVDFRKLRDNPEFFDTENEELTDAGYAEVDRLTEQQARDNLNLPSIDSIGDLDGAYHRAQADAMRVLLDGLGIEYEDNSSHNSQYLNVGRLKVRFADHGNTTRTVMHGADMLMNVSPNGATFTEALQAILDEGAPTPDSGELGSQALERSKMQERPAVRADESGSPEEPAQSGSGAGSKISVALESRAAQSALPLSGGQSAAQSAWDIDPDTRLTQLIYKLQDKHVDTKSVVKAIEEGTGSQVADSFDPYLGEELYHKRTATRVDTFVEQELKPLLNAMRLAGVGREEFEEYLHARHAKEANQIIRDRDGMADGGSGMLDADAQAYLSGLDPAKRLTYERLARQVDAIIAKTRQTLVDYGLESQDTIDAWARMFQHYVPLNREDMESGTGIGQGFSVRGPASKSRTGSSRQVVDILANIAQQRDRAIIRGEKNRVATALYGLAYLNPNKDVWEAGVVPTKQVVVDGKIATVPDHNYKNEPNVIVARIKDRKGQVHDRAIVFNRHNDRAMRLAGAMKNLDAPQMGELMNAAGKITRYLSAINTQYNPVFVFVNLVRDAQGAVFNLASTPLAGMQKEVAGHTVSALAGIYSDLRAHRNGNQPSSKWAMLYEEMQREGGTTGYRDMFGTASERSAEQIDKLIDPEWWAKTGWGKAVTVGGRLIAPETFLASKAAEWIFNPLSDANETAENAVRLAVYKTAIDHGMSKARAASLSKNITVNFNRKGQLGSQMNALYAFFNAAMQGTARLAETLFEQNNGKIRLSKAGGQIVAGGVLLGMVQALALAAAFDDDDPPDFVRERNLIIPVGGKRYVAVPMPLGLHVLPSFGRIPMEWILRGFKKPGKAATDFLSVFAEAFNPIGNAGMSWQTLTPSVIDPVIALLENKDWSGKPIARQGFDKNEPGYLRAKDTASPFGKFMAKAINTVTGGTPYTAGMYSPTPDQIDYLLGQATGGVGRETLKAFETVESAVTGEDQPVHKVPLLGRFYGKAEGKSHESALFYENLDRIDRLDKELKGMRKDGLDTSEVLREHPETRLARMSNRVRLRISMLRRQKQKLVEAGDRQAVKVIEAQMTDVMRNFNASVGGATAEADTAH